MEDLVKRAVRGEDVRITDPALGTVRLTVVDAVREPPKKRQPGRWKDRIPPPPDGFFDPMTGDELKDWYGDAK